MSNQSWKWVNHHFPNVFWSLFRFLTSLFTFTSVQAILQCSDELPYYDRTLTIIADGPLSLKNVRRQRCTFRYPYLLSILFLFLPCSDYPFISGSTFTVFEMFLQWQEVHSPSIDFWNYFWYFKKISHRSKSFVYTFGPIMQIIDDNRFCWFDVLFSA